MSIECPPLQNADFTKTLPEKALVTVASKDETSMDEKYSGILSKINMDSLRSVPSEKELRDLYSTPEGPIIIRPENPMRPNRIIATMTEDKNGVERYDFGRVKNITASEIVEVMEKGIDLFVSPKVAQFIDRGEFLNNKDTLVLKDPKSEAIVVFSERAILDIYEKIIKKEYSSDELRQLFIDKSFVDKIEDKSEDSICFVDRKWDSVKRKYIYSRVYIVNNSEDKDLKMYDVLKRKMYTFANGKEDGGYFYKSFAWPRDNRFTVPVPRTQDR